MGDSAGSLSTLEGKIVNENGTEVILKGFALSGFESSFSMTGDLSIGSDSIAHDWRTNMYRWVCSTFLHFSWATYLCQTTSLKFAVVLSTTAIT